MGHACHAPCWLPWPRWPWVCSCPCTQASNALVAPAMAHTAPHAHPGRAPSPPCHLQLWTYSPAHQQLVIESKTATTRHLSKAFPLVGAQLKRTPEGRALLSGLDGKEE